MVLLREEQARLLESLAVEGVRVFEDLAHGLHVDVLGEDHFTSLLERWDVESVRKLFGIKNRLVAGYAG